MAEGARFWNRCGLLWTPAASVPPSKGFQAQKYIEIPKTESTVEQRNPTGGVGKYRDVNQLWIDYTWKIDYFNKVGIHLRLCCRFVSDCLNDAHPTLVFARLIWGTLIRQKFNNQLCHWTRKPSQTWNLQLPIQSERSRLITNFIANVPHSVAVNANILDIRGLQRFPGHLKWQIWNWIVVPEGTERLPPLLTHHATVSVSNNMQGICWQTWGMFRRVESRRSHVARMEMPLNLPYYPRHRDKLEDQPSIIQTQTRCVEQQPPPGGFIHSRLIHSTIWVVNTAAPKGRTQGKTMGEKNSIFCFCFELWCNCIDLLQLQNDS